MMKVLIELPAVHVKYQNGHIYSVIQGIKDMQSYGYNNYEQHRLDTTYYNLVIRYNLKKRPGYMFRPSFGHPQADTNITEYRSVLHGIPFCLH
jgi:hypothetical protein